MKSAWFRSSGAVRRSFLRTGSGFQHRPNLMMSSLSTSELSNARPNVFITRKFDFPEVIDLLESVANVEIHDGEDDPIPRETLISKMENVQGLLPMLTDRIDGEIMDAVAKKGQLKVISNYAVGYNNISVPDATQRGIIVTNTPEVLDESTADCAFMLMMAVARRLVEVDKYVREGKWIRAWGPKMLLGSDISGKTLGIIGLGRIGTELVPRAKGFKMKVIYNKRRRLDLDEEKNLGVEYREFDDLLQEADFVSLHLPLDDSTRHTIGERELKLMKPTAFLINTARGPVVDEKALAEALEKKTIAGAGLDVHYNEPTEPDNPILKLDNVVVLPHIGSATVETRLAMAMRAAENLVAVFKGENPKDVVNPEVLK